MTVLDRVFLSVIAILLVFLAGALAWTIWVNNAVILWLQGLSRAPQAFLDGGILVLFFLLLAAYLVLVVTRLELQKAIVHKTDLGSVRISLQSVQGLIVRAVRQVKGVKDVRVTIREGEALGVNLELALYPDYHIPELTENVQNEVRTYLHQTVGITVGEVNVLVKGIVGQGKSRID